MNSTTGLINVPSQRVRSACLLASDSTMTSICSCAFWLSVVQ